MIIGTCSICGGAVQTPDIWHGIVPPTPTCTQCGAHKADHGPVIDMKPAPRQDVVTYLTYRTNQMGRR